MSIDLITYTQAAEELGVKPQTIPDLVKSWGIRPKDMPLNGKAKGLDRDDMRTLRRALNKPLRRPAGEAVAAR